MSATAHITTTQCPSWCTEPTGHDADELKSGCSRVHPGAGFGPFRVDGYEDGATGALDVAVFFDDVDADDLTPADLRKIAEQAEQAARWLEEQTA